MENELIAKIIQTAETTAAAIAAEAAGQAEEVCARAGQFATNCEKESAEKIGKVRAEIASRAKSVAELDAAKLILKAKVEAVDGCFASALEAVVSMKDEDYLKYIKKLLASYAEDGDEVTVSEQDKKRITADFIKKAATELKIKLKPAKDCGAFRGGVILSKDGVDKNLTVEMQLKENRERMTGEVVRLLGI